MSSLLKRWATGLVLVPILLVVILFGSESVFAAMVMLFVVGGILEYSHIVFGAQWGIEKIEGLIFAVVIPFLGFLGNDKLMLAVLSALITVVFILFVWKARKETQFDFLTVTKVIFGVMYIPFMMTHFIFLRMMTNGILWIIFVLVLAFAGDIAALYIGKYFGKRKLIPSISPGKTIEGLFGLVVGSVLACLLFAVFLMPDISLMHITLLAFVGSIIGQLGDICESAIKRSYGLKDSGVVLPGHGGLLDRLDCLVFIAPFVYYYRLLVIAQ